MPDLTLDGVLHGSCAVRGIAVLMDWSLVERMFSPLPNPLMGVVGAVLVAAWAKNLIVSTGKVLPDREMDAPVVEEIREVIAASSHHPDTALVDLHVWRAGKNAYSCAMSLLTSEPSLTARPVHAPLAVHEEIVQATIEVNMAGAASTTATASILKPAR